MGFLFPRLPDEIGRECLLRVELNSHHKLRCVCKSWNAELKSAHFYQERKRLKISEQRICMIQKIDGICNRVAIFDPEKNTCKILPPIPTEINGISHSYFVKQKLVLITDLLVDSTKSRVWLYDFICSKWRQGAKMPRWLTKFVSAADDHRGLIYVAGGFTSSYIDARWQIYSNPVQSVSVYNVEEDKWDDLPDLNTYVSRSCGAFAEGKFYVMSTSLIFEVFDSYTRSWTTIWNRFKGWHRFISAFGRLYGLSVRGLIEYDYSQDKLSIVGTFPELNWGRSIDFAVLISNKIFVGISGFDTFAPQRFFILEPPSETGGTLKLIGIERPSSLQGSAICAATLDL
ncbi:hypothetical protein SUGI_0211240 [Cryptomeria japonica]|uniref:F-box/kelch-repeat protein At1g80440-like n=1 Tax=Cryptomeria japonica TaxID=3369 RepID=UPI002408DAE5|nr:F-box/kelch-repeat protein At1g80440-like [Cryptomeria japonica]GLJ13389.1 hypothetical protein SUGI_0211240 [Cryptomeria japonica]